jgi:hypothetical protein
METGNGLTAEKMIAALEKANGFVSDACHDLGCSRQHFYVKLKGFPTVQAKMEEIREKRTDYVEGQMMKLIDDLNPTMIIFYLKTQAKNRGYVERHEIASVDLGKLTDEQLMNLAEGKDVASE